MRWVRVLGLMAVAVLFTLGPIGADLTPTPTCGDLDNSGDIDLTDAIYLFEYIFGQQPPLPDPSVADVNCDDKIDISDVTYLLAFVFYGAAEPCADCPLGENHAPIIESFTASDNVLPSSGGTVIITVVATDQDGDVLTYSYSASFGAIVGSGSTVSWVLPANTGSSDIQAVLTVTVSDGEASSTAMLAVTIQGQSGPSGGTLSGTLMLPAGQNGDLSGAKAYIYTSIVDWSTYSPFMFTAATGSGVYVTYSLSNIPAGSYLFDAWKDSDGDLVWSSGDYVGWFGTGSLGAPNLVFLYLATGQSRTIDIYNMILIP
jgi:hypothetical protein